MWNAISLLGAPPVATTAASPVGNETDFWTRALIEAFEGATPVGREVALEPNAPENRLDSAPTAKDTEEVSAEPLVFVLTAPDSATFTRWTPTLAEPQAPETEAGQVSPSKVAQDRPLAWTPTLAEPQTPETEAGQVPLSKVAQDQPRVWTATLAETHTPESEARPVSPTMGAQDQPISWRTTSAVLRTPETEARQVTHSVAAEDQQPAFEVAFENTILDPIAERQQVVKLMTSEPEAAEVEAIPTKSAADRDEAEPQVLRTATEPIAQKATDGDGPRDQRQDSEARREQAIAQVRERLETLDLGRPQRVTIKLNPEELGQVVITLKRIGTSVETSIHAENPQTREALGQGKEALAGALEQRRFELTSFRVSNLRESEMFFGQFGQQHGAPRQQAQTRVTPISQPETRNGVRGVSPRPLARMGYVPKGVDLWI